LALHHAEDRRLVRVPGRRDEWALGAPHVVGPDVGTAAALFLAAKAPDRVTSLTLGGGAVRFPIEAGGALKDIIEAPSLDVVRGLDARTNIGYAVEAAAPGRGRA
jgi:pimeloyl-ACP methyl ester carboxylesterase